MEHPIQGLMKTAMDSIKGMVDVNTVVGDAVETPDGTVIIPISRVSLGFVAGGGQYAAGAAGPAGGPGGPERDRGRAGGEGGGSGAGAEGAWPFGGGSGAGVSVSPVGFLVVSNQGVRFLPVDQRATLERILDAAPDLLDRLQAALRRDGRRRAGGDGETPAATVHQGGFEDPGDYEDL